MLCIDIETNLIPATKIWVAVTEDVDTGEVLVYETPQGLQAAIDATDGVIAHNGIGFDFPVLEELWGITIPVEKMVDTLVMAKLYQPQIDNGHSLKAWGMRLGHDELLKQDFDKELFEHGLTEEMLDYCKQDVHVNVALYKKLRGLFDQAKISDWALDVETRVAYITAEQERNGFKLDVEKAQRHHDFIERRMEEIDMEMSAIFPPITTQRVSEKTGKPLKDHVEYFNVGSRQQVAKRLRSLGAVFTEITETGQTVINEKTLGEIDLPEAKLVQEYMMLQKRLGLFAGWLNNVGDDGRIHGRVNTIGAITGRMTHSKPNMAQIPSVGSPWGQESRECFIVDEGNVLVGCDASGIELRMLAHYMDDPEYTKQILEGDIHTYNQNMAGLSERSQAKTFIYGWLYGAGDAKIGSIVGGSSKQGKILKERFLENIPQLAKLIKKVKAAADTGKVPSLVGGWIRIRHDHAALNTLLQGAGATVMKVALIEAYNSLTTAKIPFKIVANVHDEWQVETPKHFGKAVGMHLRQGIINAGVVLKLNCPLDGEFNIGNNWAETH